ncbi:PhzF family phenazine biosynthesis isomerase [Microbacterium lushaniae]|uniref:PhzF family phenazine biosynthesis isomerase n=1 Tax=Microbacterium lushaniae TaxID=2614639 RepID=UPI001930EC3A
MPAVLRYAAFTDPDRPGGGNPAGVVLDADGLTDAEIQRIAAEVGFSETAFLYADGSIRFFSPVAEVPFCGHATVATAVALAARDGAGPLTFATPVGEVELETSRGADGVLRASFTSVEPRIEEFAPAVLRQLLHLLGIRGRTSTPPSRRVSRTPATGTRCWFCTTPVCSTASPSTRRPCAR